MWSQVRLGHSLCGSLEAARKQAWLTCLRFIVSSLQSCAFCSDAGLVLLKAKPSETTSCHQQVSLPKHTFCRWSVWALRTPVLAKATWLVWK